MRVGSRRTFYDFPANEASSSFWKRLVEVFLYANFTAHGSRFARGAFRPVGNQPGNRLSRFRNDDFFSARSQLDEPGKLCLGLMNINFCHDGPSLAQSAQDDQS